MQKLLKIAHFHPLSWKYNSLKILKAKILNNFNQTSVRQDSQTCCTCASYQAPVRRWNGVHVVTDTAPLPHGTQAALRDLHLRAKAGCCVGEMGKGFRFSHFHLQCSTHLQHLLSRLFSMKGGWMLLWLSQAFLNCIFASNYFKC